MEGIFYLAGIVMLLLFYTPGFWFVWDSSLYEGMKVLGWIFAIVGFPGALFACLLKGLAKLFKTSTNTRKKVGRKNALQKFLVVLMAIDGGITVGPVGVAAVIIIYNLRNKKHEKFKLSDEIIMAADRGEETAKKELHTAFENGLSDSAHNQLRKKAYYPRAIAGDSVAQYWMGFLAQMVDEDVKMAQEWYEKSAAQGNSDAMLALAYGYSKDYDDSDFVIGFGFDATKERYWKMEAAKCGNTEAQVELGLDYFIEGDKENALKMYQSATSSKKCKVLRRAYEGLANIYGNLWDEKNYNAQLQEEYLIRILEMKQKNANNIEAYDEVAYASAAFALGSLYLRNYKSDKTLVMLKRSAYCYVLAFSRGQEYAKEYIENSEYKISEQEMNEWQKHARMLCFYLPDLS